VSYNIVNAVYRNNGPDVTVYISPFVRSDEVATETNVCRGNNYINARIRVCYRDGTERVRIVFIKFSKTSVTTEKSRFSKNKYYDGNRLFVTRRNDLPAHPSTIRNANFKMTVAVRRFPSRRFKINVRNGPPVVFSIDYGTSFFSTKQKIIIIGP